MQEKRACRLPEEAAAGKCAQMRRPFLAIAQTALTRAFSIVTLWAMEQMNQTIELPLPGGKTLRIYSDKAQAERCADNSVIAVYDDRHTGNPSFQIENSCRVTRRRDRLEVLKALIAFNREHPADPPWQRSLHSLEREWAEHNLAYRVGFLRSRARSVDLDNHAEGKGAFGYFLQSAWGVVKGYLKPKK